MDIELCAVSGYSEVGRNMTAIRVGDEVIIVDMGISIQAISTYEKEKEGNLARALSSDQLINIGAIPNDKKIEDWKHLVKAIVLGHGHYDHIAAVQYLAAKYKCQVIGSPYTIQVLKSILKDDDVKLPNKFTVLDLDDKIKISENITIELISMSHSTLQCAMVAVHTPEGSIIYANDFKFDNTPVLGEKPNYKRLKELGDKGNVLLLITESVNALEQGKTPSERVAREMLKDVLLETENKGKVIFVTCFASNIARIKSIIEFGKKLGRKIVIIGRSMGKYVGSAEAIELVKFSKDAEIVTFGGYRRRKLKEIDSNRGKYLVITTGSQGEPGSVLDKIINKQLPFTFREGDIVIFSCRTIPVPMNIANRENLEAMLKNYKVRMFKNLHASGHGSIEDIRDFISMVKPKNIMPSQGDLQQKTAVAKLSEEMKYIIGKNVHLLKDGQRLKII